MRLPRLPQASLAPNQGSEPSLLVVIPARNQALTLPRLLAAPKLQSLQPGGLVVDLHSRDGTAAIAQAAGAPLLTRAGLQRAGAARRGPSTRPARPSRPSMPGQLGQLGQASSAIRRWKAWLADAGALVGAA